MSVKALPSSLCEDPFRPSLLFQDCSSSLLSFPDDELWFHQARAESAPGEVHFQQNFPLQAALLRRFVCDCPLFYCGVQTLSEIPVCHLLAISGKNFFTEQNNSIFESLVDFVPN